MRRHPFDALSFGFGALFAVAAAVLASDRFDVLDLGDSDLGPVVVMALGAALVVAAITSARSDRNAVAPAGPSDEHDGPEADLVAESSSGESHGAPSDAWPVPETRDPSPPRGDEDESQDR